jgi:transposase
VLVGQVRKRKTHRDLLAVFDRLRACYEMRLRIYLVMDNLSSHRHPRVKMFYGVNNIEPVWTPTYASWLNAIEAHLSGIRKFAINGSDEPSHDNRRRRIQRYLTWRNQQRSANGCSLGQFRHIKLERH